MIRGRKVSGTDQFSQWIPGQRTNGHQIILKLSDLLKTDSK